MYSIISTVGTSVFGKYGTPLYTDAQNFDKTNVDLASIANSKKFDGSDLYAQALSNLQAQKGEFLRRASAEINGIEGILENGDVKKGNIFYFLASRSPAGVLAARVLADFCKERYDTHKSDVKIIADLQMGDADSFRKKGIPNLIQTVYGIIVESGRDGLQAKLNITGGFKAAIPYLTIVGMLRNVPVSLIHETGNQLISLGGLPFSLNQSLLREYKKLLFNVQANQLNGVKLNDLKKSLGLERSSALDEHELWSLFENLGDDRFTLSGLGTIALEEIASAKNVKPVRLSLQACDRLSKEDKGSRTFKNWVEILDNIGNKDWRDKHRHEYKGCVFPACKMYGTKDRAFYEDRPDYVFILELTIEKPNSEYDSIPTDINDYDPLFAWNGLVEE